jgi:hypothetical protein
MNARIPHDVRNAVYAAAGDITGPVSMSISTSLNHGTRFVEDDHAEGELVRRLAEQDDSVVSRFIDAQLPPKARAMTFERLLVSGRLVDALKAERSK